MPSNYIGRSDLPLGIRNNNPGDLRPGDSWQGMIGENGGFIVFQDMGWGTRALATDIVNEWKKGNNSIAKFISIYAPPAENDTAGYIASVAQDTGFDANTPILLDSGSLQSLVRAIINKEVGGQYSILVTDDDIDAGIALMNNSVASFLQATGIAAQAAVTQDPQKVLLIAGIAGLAIYILTRKK